MDETKREKTDRGGGGGRREAGGTETLPPAEQNWNGFESVGFLLINKISRMLPCPTPSQACL